MSAEQPRIDADTLGRVAWEAGQQHMRERYGPRVGEYQWSEQVNPDQDGYRRIGQAVARVVLSAAVRAVRQEAERRDWGARPTEWAGYMDALGVLAAFAESIGAGEVQP